MRHLKKGKKFGRTRGPRAALLRTLLYQLIMRERLVTTEARAKAIRPALEKAITAAVPNTLAARRLLASRLPKEAAKKLITALAPRFTGRTGGYTRITKLQPRKSDGSKQAVIEFVS